MAEPPPPGTLPEQDHDRIDVEEQAARTLTTGIGLVVGAICLVLLLILCARAVVLSGRPRPPWRRCRRCWNT